MATAVQLVIKEPRGIPGTKKKTRHPSTITETETLEHTNTKWTIKQSGFCMFVLKSHPSGLIYFWPGDGVRCYALLYRVLFFVHRCFFSFLLSSLVCHSTMYEERMRIILFTLSTDNVLLTFNTGSVHATVLHKSNTLECRSCIDPIKVERYITRWNRI